MKTEIKGEFTGNVLKVKAGDRVYAWDPEKRLGDLLSTDDTKRASSYSVSDGAGFDDDSYFVFYAEDCFDPSMHIVRARSFEDAYEAFIDGEAERGHYVLTKEYDEEMWNEYVRAGEAGENGPDHISYSSNGTPVHSECFQGFEVEFLALESL